MKQSYNTLIIDALTIEPVEGDTEMRCILYKAKVKFKIEFFCEETITMYKSIHAETSSTYHNDIKALKYAVENFFNGKIDHYDTQIRNVETSCTEHPGINYFRVDLPEPYKSMFETLAQPFYVGLTIDKMFGNSNKTKSLPCH